MSKTLSKLVWVLVAIVLAIGIVRLITSRPQRSADQKILIDKSK